MALPQTVRVKLSSEPAESIALTRVALQEMPVRDLVERILALAGKDVYRIQEILSRGTLVSGASRFRWEGWKADAGDLEELLGSFPDPDPSLPFDAEQCIRAVLRAGNRLIEIPREAGERKGIFQSANFWDGLMNLVRPAVSYSGYSYRERADRFVRSFTLAEVQEIRRLAEGVRYSVLRDQIRSLPFTAADLYVTRR